MKQEIIRSARGAGKKKIHNINFPSDGNGWDYKYYKSSRVCQKFSFFLFYFFYRCVPEVGARNPGVEWENIAGDLRENQIYMLRWCYDTAKWEFDLWMWKMLVLPRSLPSSTLKALGLCSVNLIHRVNMLWVRGGSFELCKYYCRVVTAVVDGNSSFENVSLCIQARVNGLTASPGICFPHDAGGAWKCR